MEIVTYLDFLLNSKPGEIWMVTRACDEHKRAPNIEGCPFRREVGEIHPCRNGCVYELVNDDLTRGKEPWEPGRWFRILNPDGTLWMETSSESEARAEAVKTGWLLERLWILRREEWRKEDATEERKPLGNHRPDDPLGPWLSVHTEQPCGDCGNAKLWQIGYCDNCGTPLYASNVSGLSLPVRGVQCVSCMNRKR